MDKTMVFSLGNDKEESFRKNLKIVYDACKVVSAPLIT